MEEIKLGGDLDVSKIGKLETKLNVVSFKLFLFRSLSLSLLIRSSIRPILGII